MENYFIEARQLSKIYKSGDTTFYALDKINLKIRKNEFISILGPSGSGKSTLMNIIGGLDVPDEGEITVGGENLKKLNDIRFSKFRNKAIGFVFQNFNLDNNLTALENIQLPLIYAKVKHTERKELAFEALKAVGLENRAGHRPSELSGGQRQRVCIARAIVNRPSIILADEPTGNLDTASGEMVMNLLTDLNKNGYTIIMVTHNPAQARVSNRTIEIMDGRIIKDVVNK